MRPIDANRLKQSVAFCLTSSPLGMSTRLLLQEIVSQPTAVSASARRIDADRLAAFFMTVKGDAGLDAPCWSMMKILTAIDAQTNI